MKKLSVVMFLVFALISWGCDDGKKTIGDEEGVILIEERSLTEEEIEEECPNGGVKIVTGFDKNGNGVLDEDEILDNYFVCHGEDGTDGDDGEDGGKGDQGDQGEKGDQGDPGNDGACFGNIAPVIGKIEINETAFDKTPIPSGVVADIEITADKDNLVYVITGSGAIIEQGKKGKHKFTLIFNSEGVYYFSVTVSDGCQMAVKSFAVNVVCTGDFPRYHKSLCWSDSASNIMTWSYAISYCEGLGGRLPTINELRALIQNCPATQTEGSCGVTDSCSEDSCWSNACQGCSFDDSGKYSVFGDTGWFWSSLSVVDKTSYAWYVDFTHGAGVHWASKMSNLNGAKCVR